MDLVKFSGTVEGSLRSALSPLAMSQEQMQPFVQFIMASDSIFLRLRGLPMKTVER